MSIVTPLVRSLRRSTSFAERSLFWLSRPFRAAYSVAFGYDLFISYAHEDGWDYARRLELALRPTFICYRDEHDALGGRPLSEIVTRGLLRSRMMVVVITAHACESKWVAGELDAFREQHGEASPGRRRPRCRLAFPIFIGAMRPQDLPDPFNWLGGHLGCRDHDPATPSGETISRIRRAFPGVRRAAGLYGASTSLVVVALSASLAVALAQAAKARREWLGRAAASASQGRFDLAEWSLAKAVESDWLRHREDVGAYASLREHRMLTPAVTLTLDDDESAIGIFNAGGATRILELNDTKGTLQLLDPSPSVKTPLGNIGDHIPRCERCGESLFVAFGDRLIVKRLNDGSPPSTVPLPGGATAIRAVGAEVRVLCRTNDGTAVVVAQATADGQVSTRRVDLQGGLPPVDRIMLLGSDDPLACSLNDGGLRLEVRYWSRRGDTQRVVHWPFAGGSVESPALADGDRYVVFESMSDFPGSDVRKEPELLAVDLMYPSELTPGRPVQRVSQDPGTVRSLARSTAFAAAVGVGHELRFWEAFNPPVVQQSSLPVTDGVQSFAVWTSPPATPCYPSDGAVVVVAKDRWVEVHAERARASAAEPPSTCVARYPLPSGFEIGRTLVSDDGATVGVVQWRNEADVTKRQLVLFRRADVTNPPQGRVPGSGELTRALGLDKGELSQLTRD